MRIQDKINKMRNQRGFTLVELMIVVAIIGVLAALAIYGVSKYLANAKTAEARTALGRISKDAQAAWQKENMAGQPLLPGDSAEASRALCPSAAASVPVDDAPLQNSKYQSEASEWNDGAGWSCLKFSMDGPQYFRYNYVMAGTAGALGNSFVASANGTGNSLGGFSLGGQLVDDSGTLVLAISPAILEDTSGGLSAGGGSGGSGAGGGGST